MSDVLLGKAFRNQHLYGLADQFFPAKPEHLLRLPINLFDEAPATNDHNTVRGEFEQLIEDLLVK
jgi:hypothetical protein